MSARELDDWSRYWSAEPWGVLRENMHAGIVAAAVLQIHTKRGKKPLTFKDFLLKDAATARDDRKAKTGAALAALKARARRKPK